MDICLETSMLSSHICLSREGHLTELLNMFASLHTHHNTEIVFYPSDSVIDESELELQDWTTNEFGQITGNELLPPNMPEPLVMDFTICAKVDADYAGDNIRRRLRTGFLVYCNCAPIYWTSKKQTSVESSSFGSELIVMKQRCKYLQGLWYKLRMIGIPITGPSYIYTDNQSVLANTTTPSSALKKKSQSIA